MVDNFGGFPAIGGLDGGVLSPVSNLDLGSAVSVTVVAIKSFSNGVISMFKGEIRVMDAETAEDLIENGLVATYAPVVPEVGENDKGKYLHTNEETGAKEWINVPSSGGGRFVVTFTYDESTETWSADKTFAECVAAWNAGQTLFAKDDDENYYPLCVYNADYIQFVIVDAETFAVLGGYGIDEEGVYCYSH